MPELGGTRIRLRSPVGSISMAAPDSRIKIMPVPGPQGLAGSASGSYEHHQITPSDSWQVPHNLGRKPWVHTLIDGDTMPSIPDVLYVDNDNLIVQLPLPDTGYAYM